MKETDLPPSGFVLSDAAMYAFQCQEVFPDLLSFAVAIPDHLKQLFLIPVFVQPAPAEPSDRIGSIASKVFRVAYQESSPTGDSDAADLFSYQSFVNYDNAPSITPGNEGSIYDDPKPDDMPVSQPGDQFCGDDSTPRYDAKVVTPFDTSYYDDGSSTDLFDEGYPYRSEQQVRHSFSKSKTVRPMKVRLALKPEVLQEHAPGKIKERADSCVVRFISYMKPTRMYTFSVHCGNVPHMVRAVLSEIDEITMTCDCPFWRWGGPEYHAKTQQFLLGKPRGTAEPPDVRDPDRKFWLCKHAYSVLRRLEHHVQQVVDEHWDMDDDDLLRTIDDEWDRLSEEAETPLEEIESEDLKMQVVPESKEEFEQEFEPEETEEPEPEPEDFGPESTELEEEEPEEPELEEEEPVVKR